MNARAADPLSPEHLQRVCDFVYRRTGMTYGESKRYYIERRVADRMARTGLRSFPAYFTLLHADNDEAEHLINSFTVNETYFYREEHQLRCLSSTLLPAIAARRGPGDLIRLWSVPCATGEEPYSLAIWLLENWALVDAYNIEIIGSDIDTRVLEAAEAGYYGERALGRLSAELRDRYFEPASGGQRRIIQDLRESIHTSQVNLVDAASMAAHGKFDVIFRRNVLIYFDDAARLAAAAHLHRALNPGGFLCLGHSESMSRIAAPFAARRFADAVVYEALVGVMDELLEQFVAEGTELAQRATDDLLALEQSPGDQGRLDSAFRAVHTLKGSAGLFDAAPLERMLHAAEDVMGAVRDGGVADQAGAVAVLLDALDAAERWIFALGRDGALPAQAELESRRLTDLLRGQLGGAAAVAAAEAASPWLDAALANLPAEACLPGLTVIRYEPHADCFFRGDDPLAIVRAVPDLRALHTAPRGPWDREKFDPFRCNLVLDFVSGAPVADIRAALRFVSDQIVLAPVPAAADDAGRGEAAGAAATLRVDITRIEALADIAGELTVAKNRLAHLAAEAAAVSPSLARALADNQATIARLAGELNRGVMDLRSVKLDRTFRRLPRLLRETASRLGKTVTLTVEGGQTGADKVVVDALYEPLLHVLRNAVDHGIEPPEARLAAGKSADGTITLRAWREGEQIVLTVHDDGAGIDPERVRDAARRRAVLPDQALAALTHEAVLDLIFAPGFSTAATVTDISGRGVGLDAVRRAMEALGGSVSVSSVRGTGTTVRLAARLAVSVTTILTVRAGGERFGVPIGAVAETARVARAHIQPVRDGAAFVLRDRTVPLLSLAALLGGRTDAGTAADARLVVAAIGDQLVGLEVDGFGARMDVVLRPLEPLLAGLRGALGTALLGDGSVLLVLDLPALAA